MALTFNTVIGGQQRTYTMNHGARYVLVDVTIGATNDYSTTAASEGISISANAAKMGLSKVLDVVNGSLRASSNGDLNQMWWVYDHSTGKMRGFQAFNDEVAGADFTAGDILRISVIGI